MHVVGLLSGGKDSVYNLLHCVKQGHEPIALATLSPPEGVSELDSYMYQTVGQDAVHLVAAALDLPLHRRTITGKAVELGSEYGSRAPGGQGGARGIAGDETEDLFELLSAVKAAHPTITALSVGAILSSYQRARVEHVCARLGLTPLSYLWQRDQSALLAEMVGAGLEAVLIKVAGVGLEPDRHLGKTLGQMQGTLKKLNSIYGSHVCGEGGEYETLTLDCPLFKKRIVFDETEIVLHDPSPMAPVAYLRIKRAHLEDKSVSPPAAEEIDVAVPSVLDEEGEVMLEELKVVATGTGEASGPGPREEGLGAAEVTIGQRGDWVAVGNVTAFNGPTSAPPSGYPTLAEELTAAFHSLSYHLANHSLSLPHNTLSLTLLLSSISSFAAANAAYASFFGTAPPARACVTARLPAGERVRLAVLARADPRAGDLARKSLHVQGLSYWAPANIGPYSQAISIANRHFISGQIGLLPPTLALPSPPNLALEAALSLQHVRRVAAAIASPDSAWPESCVCWVDSSAAFPVARRAWEAFVNVRSTAARPPPFLLVATPELPKGAQIEWQTAWHSGEPVRALDDADEDDEEEEADTGLPVVSTGSTPDAQFHTLEYNAGEALQALVLLRTAEPAPLRSLLRLNAALERLTNSAFSLEVFHTAAVSQQSVLDLAHSIHASADAGDSSKSGIAITPVPVDALGSEPESEWTVALLYLGAA